MVGFEPTTQNSMVLPPMPFAKLLGVRHRLSLQVEQAGMSPVLLYFVAQSGRGAAFIIPPEPKMITGTGGTSFSVS